MKVFVYHNLHKKVFSIKALEGPRKGRVVGYAREITLQDVTFRVSQAGRQRVLRERRKNVHAGVVGNWTGFIDPAICQLADIGVTYNPYKYDSFVSLGDERPIYQAPQAHLINRQVYV